MTGVVSRVRPARSRNHGSIPDRERILFLSKASRPDMGSNHPPTEWASVTRWPASENDSSLHLVPKSRIS